MPDTYSTYTTLSETERTALRCLQSPGSTRLQRLCLDGAEQIALTDDELHVFLCALPPEALARALVARNAVALLAAEIARVFGEEAANPFFALDETPEAME